MSRRVLVTGALGNVGREVVALGRARGLAVTAGHYDAARARAALPTDVDVVALDFNDRTTWSSAAEGQDAVFLVRPPAIADVENNLNPFVDCCRESGVDHVVFLSVAGAERNRFVPHRKVEDHLAAIDDHHTNLRPGFFAQNLQDAYREDIVEHDRIYVPAGRAQVNWVDVRDVAEVAVNVMAAPTSHRGKAYTLAGPGPVRWSSVVRVLSEVLGRDIRYEPASVFGYANHLRRRGLPRGAIAVQTLLHFLLRFGQGATEDPTLERLLARRPRSIEDYIRDHVEVWDKPS